jgi:hypothetical protein
MTTTQDERHSSRVFNSDVVFCSRAEAFLYVVLHRRDPNEQKTEVPAPVSGRYHRCVDSYEDRPSTLATFSVEMPVSSDRSLADRSRRL